jgi:hypothetical protein
VRDPHGFFSVTPTRICERITLHEARNVFYVRAVSRVTYADPRTFR